MSADDTLISEQAEAVADKAMIAAVAANATKKFDRAEILLDIASLATDTARLARRIGV